MISASYKMNEVICTDVEVGISEKDNLKFIDEQDLMNYINNYGQSILINQRIKDIDKELRYPDISDLVFKRLMEAIK